MPKLISDSDLKKILSIEKPLVFVPMCVDYLHHGHTNIIKKASNFGNVIIGLMTDKGIKTYKGSEPIISFNNRKKILSNLKNIKLVIPLEGLKYSQISKKIKPNYFVHGSDWNEGKQNSEKKKLTLLMKKWRGKVITVPYTGNISSTIIKKTNFIKKKSFLIWITGLSGSGKTTFATSLSNKLKSLQDNVVFLDGDSLRKVLINLSDNDNQYTTSSRLKYSKTYVELCKLLYNQNKIVIISTISMNSSILKSNKKLFKNYCEIFLNRDLKKIINKNSKNVYFLKNVKPNKNVVGLDIDYEIPKNPNFIFENMKRNEINKNVDEVLEFILK